MKIITRNINWIRASVKKWFVEVITEESPDILCLQEIKAYENQIPPEMHLILKDYNLIWNAARKPWYAGTAIFYKKNLSLISYTIFEWNELFSADWRVMEVRFLYKCKEYVLFNVYFPNWNPRADGVVMLGNKLSFYDTFLQYVSKLKQDGLHVICSWDFNVAHTEIDLSNPQWNKRSVGFLPAERAKLDMMIKDWFVDLFRYYHPNEAWHYTRRSYREWMKDANRGWRYDYFFVSQNVVDAVSSMSHLTAIRASDHCPLRLIFK